MTVGRPVNVAVAATFRYNHAFERGEKVGHEQSLVVPVRVMNTVTVTGDS